jgi:DMSO/TMAO reductase YedYZ heme-binding membrane subunit
MDPRRRELTVAQIERLKQQRARLQRDWSLIPRLGYAAVLVVPAYLVWGLDAAMAAILFVPCLLGTAAYLVGVRLFENKQTLQELEHAVAMHDASQRSSGGHGAQTPVQD